MTVLASKTIDSDGCFELSTTNLGGLHITAAGTSGNLAVYSQINGVNALVGSVALTCEPAATLDVVESG